MTSTGHNDRLTAMLYAQRDLQARAYDQDPGKMQPEELMAYVRDNVLALTDELHEALGETGWKPWATSNHINVTSYLSELIDAWHFLMNLLIATGIEPATLADRFYEGYVMKQARNVKRQEDGYDGVEGKCPQCKRAYDDAGVKCFTYPTKRDAWCDKDRVNVRLIG